MSNRVVLFIGNEEIESIPVSLKGCKTVEHRQEKVQGIVNWLKYNYRDSLRIKKNWEIVVELHSKLNSLQSFTHE